MKKVSDFDQAFSLKPSNHCAERWSGGSLFELTRNYWLMVEISFMLVEASSKLEPRGPTTLGPFFPARSISNSLYKNP